MKTVRIRFRETYTVKAVGGATYEKGSVHELRYDTALHFLKRDLAEVCQIQPPPDAAPVIAVIPIPEPEPVPDPPPKETPADPLVSCVMPTWNRRKFIGAAIDCWVRQTYQNRELVILDDGDDQVRDLVPKKDKRIRYVRLKERENTGRKRNHVIELSRGEIICHFDDDDWSAPDRIEDQVRRLQQTGLPITGYGTLLFWDVIKQEAKRYRSNTPGYVCGTSLCFLRSYWESHRFDEIQMASDNRFVYPAAKAKQIAGSQDQSKIVARIHDCHHTSPKSGVGEGVPRELIPAAFWENEKLRLP